MTEPQLPEESIFAQALEVPDADRTAFLDRACGGNEDLRAEVEWLLQANARTGDLLDLPERAAVADPVEGPGAAVGAYKLLEQIGEGGFGVVYLAEQQQPVCRKVALKVLKPGMDTRQVVARFEAERQAMALMDHPNIAKIHDGGTTPTGRPYFVMELVRGAPITEFCDRGQLSVPDRLDLFVQVCQAVQHAHTKAVIHRDLKPSNVLVALADGAAVPKVIDFGVAKALGQRLTDKTLFTGATQMVGTPLYMSPEQADLSGLDVDTRSDVYSLGVILYELLTRTTPFDGDRLKTAGYDEIRRIIREEEPVRPSSRVSTVDQAASTASGNCGSDPRRLRRLLRGELDWVVMKCLEKDRARRYETVDALAKDIERYLADEPVLACPPSVTYRVGKFARRNKRALVMGAVLAAAVVVAAGSIGWGMRDRAARRAESTAQARESLARARTWVGENKLAEARQELALAIGHLGDHRANEPQLMREIQALESDLARFDRFLTLIDRAHEAELAMIPEAVADVASESPSARRRAHTLDREPARAVPFLLECLAQYAVFDRDDWVTLLDESSLHPGQIRQIRRSAYEELLWLVNDLTTRLCDHRTGKKCSPDDAAQQGLVYLQKAESAHAPTPAFYRLRGRCRQALGDDEAARLDATVAEQTPGVIGLDHYLPGYAALRLRDKAKAAEQFHAALRIEPGHYWSMMSLGYCLTDLGKERYELVTAVTAFSGCILKRPDHALPYFCRSLAYARMRRWDDALADSSKAIELNPGDAMTWGQRGLLHTERGDYARALADYARALELDPDNANALTNRSIANFRRGATADAVTDASTAIALKPTFANAWLARGIAYASQKRYGESVADCSRAIELDGELVSAWNNRGIARMELREFPQAAADFSEVVKLDPEYAHGWCNRGNAHSKQGELDEAIADYGRCIEVQPTYQAAWYNRGSVYLQRRRYPEAVADFSKAIELNARHAQSWSNRGNAYAGLQQFDQAMTDFSRALEIKPELIEARYNRGVLHHERRDWELAVADLSKVIEVDPKYQTALSRRGNIYCDQLRHYEKADADFSRLLDFQPGDASVWFRRGNARRLLKQFDKAISDYSKAIEIRREYVEAWVNRGMARISARQYPQAADDFREAIRLKPDFKLPQRSLAACLNDLAWPLLDGMNPKGRDPRRAVEMAKEAVQLDPQQGNYWLLLGVAEYRADNWMAAWAALDKALELRKGGGCTDWFYLAMTYRQLEDRETAGKWFDRAAGQMGTDRVRDSGLFRLASEAATLMRRGEWLVSWAAGYEHAEAGRWDKATAELTRVVEHKPGDAQVWYRLALLRLYTGDMDGYRQVCRDMLEHFGRSNDEDAVHHLIWTCTLAEGALADYGPVLQTLENARVKDPGAPVHLQRHGIALYGAGRWAEAAAKLDAARRAATWAGNIWDWLFLARAHRRLGQPEEANRWLAQADDWMAEHLKRVDWATRLQAEVLYREVRRLIDAAKK